MLPDKKLPLNPNAIAAESAQKQKITVHHRGTGLRASKRLHFAARLIMLAPATNCPNRQSQEVVQPSNDMGSASAQAVPTSMGACEVALQDASVCVVRPRLQATSLPGLLLAKHLCFGGVAAKSDCSKDLIGSIDRVPVPAA
jgi:hypothetical protein